MQEACLKTILKWISMNTTRGAILIPLLKMRNIMQKVKSVPEQDQEWHNLKILAIDFVEEDYKLQW